MSIFKEGDLVKYNGGKSEGYIIEIINGEALIQSKDVLGSIDSSPVGKLELVKPVD